MSDNHMSLVDFFDLHQKLAANSLILDVRRPDEFSEGHIEGAMNIPLDELTARYLELKSFAHIYIHCKRGGRAKTAFDILKQLGMTNIVCIHDAGMDQWIQNGYPVKR
jgi:phage shock protein E